MVHLAEWIRQLNKNDTREFGFLKVDIAGHSRITRECPYQEIERVFDAFEDTVEKAVSTFGGMIFGWQGDGGLCVFYQQDRTKMARSAFKALKRFSQG